MIAGRQRSTRGASSVEYALLAALVAVAIVAAVSLLGGSTRDLFQNSCASLVAHSGDTC
ncbi:Flp family type IVb pilin [Nocardioides panacis]|uniref:Flp family type IVb pilin n=1 Tax=Nocardioides panacis TaxID=2849501 RepID=A0A975XYG7_9ACTN|nr:Flp family type IVb pilin [Nocardioides panacis]QWZ06367.1 Flp family type IVb pilin [Nocardioides panacis]